MSGFEEWVKRTTNNATTREIGVRVGVSHTTVLRWLHHGPPPRAVVKLAVAYHGDLLAAMIACGWLFTDEIGEMSLAQSLPRVPTVRLTGELHKRAVEDTRRRAG